jgi:hypothetical protein
MAACEASPAPDRWRDADFIDVAEQLAGFHAAFWDATERLSAFPWLRLRRPAVAAELRQARDHWQALGADERFTEVLGARRAGWLDDMLSRIATVLPCLEALPLTLCHGDCHSGNVLRDADGAWVWADWQEVGIGYGPDDLSFFFQRASFAGATIPYEAAVTAYHARLEEEIGRRIPPATLQRALDAADLWSRAIYWPAYLSWASARQVGAMVERIRLLAARLGVDR